MLQRESWELSDFLYPNHKNGNIYIGNDSCFTRIWEQHPSLLA